jgi:hypothetical protein
VYPVTKETTSIPADAIRIFMDMFFYMGEKFAVDLPSDHDSGSSLRQKGNNSDIKFGVEPRQVQSPCGEEGTQEARDRDFHTVKQKKSQKADKEYKK